MDVVKRINIQRFRQLGNVVRIDEDTPPRRVFDAVVSGQRRPRTRRKHQVEEAQTSVGVTNWRQRRLERSFKAG